MSLFQARTWWEAPTPQGEDGHYDVGCQCVGNIDNDPSGSQKIVVGSYNGMVRVYHPQAREYRVDHLCMEQKLQHPVIQVLAGRFVNASSDIFLAVLHPRHLAVYACRTAASGGALQYYNFQVVYEHNIERPCFNMCMGTFGALHGRDSIAVQSIDGVLFVFEQESFSFKRQLPDFLVPGPIAYNPKTDS